MTCIPSITQAASAVKAAELRNNVDLAVAKKQHDAAKQSGDAVIQLIQSAANISKSQVDFHA